ncbi:transglycosylase [Sphaerisporangium rufum]|uniref:Transglycosylase n=1 Tax=Sphaerisporangium rufum TaxID=1381558 RepID=A0A919R046_9ACTN|nr:GlsB/YeaQ/YmgE family stress response membrane protein [Sphaerisporangium rufum]GII77316.1 transglycosylase [Sphaerisporangium rufum]
MTIGGIISAIIIGAIIGVLARLIIPGRQPIPWWLTIIVGIVAALIGTAIARGLGVATTSGIDWIELIIQIVLAIIGVLIAVALWTRRGRVT